jgi:hypothetical protein
LVEANVDTTFDADFAILLTGTLALSAADFIL